MIVAEVYGKHLPAWDRNLMRQLAQASLDHDWKVTASQPLTLVLITWTPNEIEQECQALWPRMWKRSW